MSRFQEIQQALDGQSPLPSDLPRLYLLGDTGAGKTTLIRKLLGTEDTSFPTTRQTRTTVAPTEYVIWHRGDFDLTVVLKPVTEIEGYIDEILRAAISRYYEDRDQNKLLRSIRQTGDQRFRMYYMLSEDFSNFVADGIRRLVETLEKRVAELQAEFPEDQDETGVFVELALSEAGEPYQRLMDAIMDEIQQRTGSVCDGKRLQDSWCVHKYHTHSKSDFIAKCKEILSSEANSISPVIQHARIRGPLLASWLDPQAEIVIIDGEGIGHDTKEVGQLDARHYDYFYGCDAILLIEESKKPFVAGGKGALKSIFQRGYGEKLFVLFTKLDEVEPYDSEDPTTQDRINEVSDGLTNVLAALREDGVDVEIADERLFYLGALNEAGMGSDAAEAVNRIVISARELCRYEAAFVEPHYDFEMLSAFLVESTKKFNDLYEEMLSKQHWKTVEAFNRRMDMGIDGFRMFTPITDFEEKINEEIDQFISKPLRWAEEVSDTLKRQSLDMIRREFNKLILDHARRSIIDAPHTDWRTAYLYSGRGSTFKRRADIEAILRRSVPPVVSSENVREFKNQVKEILRAAIENCKKAESGPRD